MHVRELHEWNVTARQAMEIQKKLQILLNKAPLPVKKPGLIAGTDVSFDAERNLVFGGVVVCRFDSLEVIETQCAFMESPFPYVPGLLSFRELPVLLEAFRRISAVPDVVLCDGQGIAHPRGFGLACHLGVILDLPSIGCAKSRLCGEHKEVGKHKGDSSELIHREVLVGLALRTRTDKNPVYISPGYRIGIEDAKEITLRSCPRYRIPEPNRKAHILVNSVRKSH